MPNRFGWKAWFWFNLVVGGALFLQVGINRLSGIIVAGWALVTLIPLYFEFSGRNAETSRAERIAAGAWLGFRRLVCFFGAAMALLVAGLAALAFDGSLRALAIVIVAIAFAFMFAWIGMFGMARYKTMGPQDVRLHEARKARYRWRW